MSRLLVLSKFEPIHFTKKKNDLTDNVITNYKINQPFTSDLSVEEGEKNSSRT